MSVFLNSQEAEDRIREIVKFGEIPITTHCRTRMRERSFTLEDLVSVLLGGEVKDQPEHDEKQDRYRYRVEGTTVDGDSAIAVTVILSFRAIPVVTIFEGVDLGVS